MNSTRSFLTLLMVTGLAAYSLSLGGCGQSAEDRSTAAYQFSHLRQILDGLRSRCEAGQLRLREGDMTFENANLFIRMKMARTVRARVDDRAKQQELIPLSDKLREAYVEKVESKLAGAEPDFQGAIAGIDECVGIIEQMEAVVSK